jgi:ribosomal protein L11 methyltransferase
MTVSSPENRGWLEISIEIDPIAHDALSAFLFDMGCEGVVTEDFPDRSFKAYLPLQKNFQDIQNKINIFLQKLKEIFSELQSPKVKFSQIRDQDWNREWRRFFRPDHITQRLAVFPAWEPVPQNLEGEVIRIDPGPAFGTGQHPTTRMCLEAMERVSLPEFWTMLDVGTGSGILAIYGAKLGASSVVAIDTDLQAVRWAKGNVALNNLSETIQISSMPLQDLKDSFSLLVANLTLGLIMELLTHFSRLLDPDGWLILSGILGNNVQDLGKHLARHGFCEDQVLRQGEWACMIAQKGKGA